jgi:hypothetical protein
MRYALLLYSASAADDQRESGIDPQLREVLERPNVTGWIRLHSTGTATTLRQEGGSTLLTDGPFVDSKELLGGLVVVDADDLEGALAMAAELRGLMKRGGAVEVRPILEEGA